MKALTLWQPWASLKACGAKEFETRGWATSYRGPIAIHAAAISIPRVMKRLFPLGEWNYAPDYEAKREFLNAVGFALLQPMDALPLGCIIATGELIAIHRIIEVGWSGSADRRIAWVDGELTPHYPSEQELLFGDWTPGRYAWEIINVRTLSDPIPAKGKQRLWDWDERGLTA